MKSIKIARIVLEIVAILMRVAVGKQLIDEIKGIIKMYDLTDLADENKRTKVLQVIKKLLTKRGEEIKDNPLNLLLELVLALLKARGEI